MPFLQALILNSLRSFLSGQKGSVAAGVTQFA
jgi:hypothetical protein